MDGSLAETPVAVVIEDVCSAKEKESEEKT
jgi:hypothetical protein